MNHSVANMIVFKIYGQIYFICLTKLLNTKLKFIYHLINSLLVIVNQCIDVHKSAF